MISDEYRPGNGHVTRRSLIYESQDSIGVIGAQIRNEERLTGGNDNPIICDAAHGYCSGVGELDDNIQVSGTGRHFTTVQQWTVNNEPVPIDRDGVLVSPVGVLDISATASRVDISGMPQP